MARNRRDVIVTLLCGLIATCVQDTHSFDVISTKLRLSLTIGAESRSIQVSWTGGLQPEQNDKILLWRSDPEEYHPDENPLLEIEPDSGDGWVNTDIKYDPIWARNSTGCYAIWAVYLTGSGRVIGNTCLSTYPTWMHDLRQYIGNRRLSELFIPGTHDSGACSDGKRNTYVTKYTVTQDESITSQLEHGIRYLDIRVGFYKGTRWPISVFNRLRNKESRPDEFWVNHGPAKMQPLEGVLKEINSFAERTNEIIIVDIQEFPVGFENDDMTSHAALLDFLLEHLGNNMAPPSLTWGATLKDIWRVGKRIIVAYDHERTARTIGRDFVWQAVEQHWGNVKDVGALKTHLLRTPELREDPIAHNFRPVASMAELTPDIWDILYDRFKGLRRMADNVNRYITKWYSEELGHSANIVALDFFRGTDIVELAIDKNKER
ncbi:PI-PLC X domain-containing protein 2-like, partial [Ctenocephalides felis]|uniref:PI-PLC X domain-containing protein 2-like n=1 Tax=Ctenocephalides felis TaxID=7515 RepID=UPI000E6E1240